MSRFRDRLASLGFSTYHEYLDSEHWKGFKAKYRASGLPRICAACGAGRVQLHHHTYQRLGCEELRDVTPLCRPCHVAVHEWLNLNKNGNVAATHKAVESLKASKAPTDSKRTKRPRGKSPKGRRKAKVPSERDVIFGRLSMIRERTKGNPLWESWSLFRSQTIEQLRETLRQAELVYPREVEEAYKDRRAELRQKSRDFKDKLAAKAKTEAAEAKKKRRMRFRVQPVPPTGMGHDELEMRRLITGIRRPIRD